MNTEFLAGLLVARLIEGMRFAVGPTIAARKQALAAIGGFAKLKDYLAEDFVMGKFAAQAGMGVILSRNIVQHRIGSQSFRANISHRLRWAAQHSPVPARWATSASSSRTRSRSPCCSGFCIRPGGPRSSSPPRLRALAAWSTCAWILRTRPRWHLLILQDILTFLFWLAGFFGNTIVWRGRRYYLYPDGRFELR